MIVKKVPTSKAAAPKSMAHNVRALVDYISGPSAGGDGEKVEHRGAENLLNVDHGGQVEEMIDLAEVAQRSPQPVQHWIISWREGEQPTAAQADAAVATFLDEMGLAEHQVIYALHRDTKNCHLHLAVNRVHPDTEKVVTVNNGFDHEVAHRAIARIERDQGWQREDRALFLARPDGQLERSRPRGVIKRQPSGPARDFEERVGECSAQRIALEVAAPIIREARSWNEMHEALAREGIRFERKGSGAILRIGNGDDQFRRLCVELAVKHGFKIANPELQQAIAIDRARLRVEREQQPVRKPAATSIAEAYRLHLADVTPKTTDGGTDPSRLDAEVAVRLRLTGHDRGAIARVIKDAAAAMRPGEHRDWDSYARRAVDFAFGLPGSRLAHHLARRRDHLLSVEGRSLEDEMASRGRGRVPLGR